MGSIQVDTVVEKDGVISIKVSGLPFKKGQEVRVTFKAKEKSARAKGKSPTKYPFSSAGRLRDSPLIGMWEDRTDIGDSVEFARKLRKRAEERQG
jgi:hypothetical protein